MFRHMGCAPVRGSKSSVVRICRLFLEGPSCTRVHRNKHMRTSIEIDDKLMQEALRLTGLRTKQEAVELGLRTLVRMYRQMEFRRFKGKLEWQGDLDGMRSSR